MRLSIQSVINTTSLKDVDCDEGDFNELNNISWNQIADALNTFISFLSAADAAKLLIIQNVIM